MIPTLRQPDGRATLVLAALVFVVMGYGGLAQTTWAQAARVLLVTVLLVSLLRRRSAWSAPQPGLAWAFFFWVAAVTAVNGQLSVGLAFSFPLLLVVYLVGQHRSMFRQDLDTPFKVLITALVALNFISLFWPSVGADGHALYFLGGKNALASVFLPLLYYCLAVWDSPSRGQTSLRFGLVGVMAFSVVYAGSGTGIVVTVFCLSYMVLRLLFQLPWWAWFSFIPVMHVLVLSGTLLASQGWARFVVEEVLGKNATYTDRTRIWELSLEQVSANWFGLGRGYSFIAASFHDVAEAHNFLLEALITGGLPAALVLLALIAWTMRSAAERERGDIGVFFVWVAAGLLGTMESITYIPSFWFLLGLIRSVSIRHRAPVRDVHDPAPDDDSQGGAGVHDLHADLQPR